MTTKSGKPKYKIPPKDVPSDDCIVYVDRVIEDGRIVNEGTPYEVHKGEHISITPVSNVREFIAIASLASGLVIEDTDDKSASMRQAEAALRSLCENLAERVVSWDWTGNEHEKLPQPHHQPEVLMSLSTDEVLYLVSAAKGETSGEKGKD